MQYTCDSSRKTCYRELFPIFLPYLPPTPPPHGALDNTNLLINITDKSVFLDSFRSRHSHLIPLEQDLIQTQFLPIHLASALLFVHSIKFLNVWWAEMKSCSFPYLYLILGILNWHLRAALTLQPPSIWANPKITTQRKLGIFQEVRR